MLCRHTEAIFTKRCTSFWGYFSDRPFFVLELFFLAICVPLTGTLLLTVVNKNIIKKCGIKRSPYWRPSLLNWSFCAYHPAAWVHILSTIHIYAFFTLYLSCDDKRAKINKRGRYWDGISRLKVFSIWKLPMCGQSLREI